MIRCQDAYEAYLSAEKEPYLTTLAKHNKLLFSGYNIFKCSKHCTLNFSQLLYAATKMSCYLACFSLYMTLIHMTTTTTLQHVVRQSAPLQNI